MILLQTKRWVVLHIRQVTSIPPTRALEEVHEHLGHARFVQLLRPTTSCTRWPHIYAPTRAVVDIPNVRRRSPVRHASHPERIVVRAMDTKLPTRADTNAKLSSEHPRNAHFKRSFNLVQAQHQLTRAGSTINPSNSLLLPNMKMPSS